MNVNSIKLLTFFMSSRIFIYNVLFIYKTVIMNGLVYFIAGFFEFLGIWLSLPAVICNTIANFLYGASGFNNDNEDNVDEE